MEKPREQLDGTVEGHPIQFSSIVTFTLHPEMFPAWEQALEHCVILDESGFVEQFSRNVGTSLNSRTIILKTRSPNLFTPPFDTPPESVNETLKSAAPLR